MPIRESRRLVWANWRNGHSYGVTQSSHRSPAYECGVGLTSLGGSACDAPQAHRHNRIGSCGIHYSLEGGNMLRSRKLVVYLLLALMFVVAAPAVSAASRETTTHETVRQTVGWTLPADQCPNLPAGVSVSGTGERLEEINTQ